MSRGRFPSGLALLLFLQILAGPVEAAVLRGVVLDPSGSPVGLARVTLSTAARVLVSVAQTDTSGRFELAELVAGSYVLAASKAGFAEFRTAVEASDSLVQEVTARLDLNPVRAELTVSAESNNVMASGDVPQPVTILSKEDLYKRATLLSDAADGEAGVHQLRTSPTLGAYFVRGLTGKNVALFRDGVRYTTSAQRGGISTFLNLVNAEGLETVEILRGPNSAQYGSDSLGGTVALMSSPAELSQSGSSWHGEVTPFYQSPMNSFGSSLAAGYSGSRLGFHTSLVGRRANTLRSGAGIDSHAAVTRFLGLPSNVMGERLPDTAHTGYGGAFHAQAKLRQNSQLVMHYERSQQDGGKRYDQLLGGDGNWIADLDNLMLDFGYLRYQHFALGPFDQFSLTGSYNAQREERVNQGGQGNPNGTITHQYEKTKAWGMQFILDKHLRRVDWIMGGEGYFERIATPSFSFSPVTGAVQMVRPRVPDGARYWTHGLYTQAMWQPLSSNRLRLSGALRFGGASYNSRAARSPQVNGKPLWPDDSLAANAVTGRIGSVVRLTDWLALHGQYSRGFRVPNVTDLGTLGLQGNGLYEAAVADLEGRQATVGDRADDRAVSTGKLPERLRPEVSDNVEVGVRVWTSRFETSFGVFRMHLDNSIISQTLIMPPGAVGQPLGEQTITRQIATGAVYVPVSASPVLVRANFSGARIHGYEHALRARLTSSWHFSENLTYIHAADSLTGLPPDMEPGIPPLTFNPALVYRPRARRYWFEAYAIIAGRQERLSSLALSDRRIGNPRSRSTIQAFFNNGARARGLVTNGILIPTGETLAQVQNRVLGTQDSAPQFTAIPGFGTIGARFGWSLGERTDLMADFTNIGDKNYRGIGWGIDGPGRGITIRLRRRF